MLRPVHRPSLPLQSLVLGPGVASTELLVEKDAIWRYVETLSLKEDPRVSTRFIYLLPWEPKCDSRMNAILTDDFKF